MSWATSYLEIENGTITDIIYTGTEFKGTITIDFSKSQTIESIKCKLIGIYKAQWSRSKPTIPFIKVCSVKTKVFQCDLNIFQNYQDNNKIVSNRISDNFKCHLSTNLPSSFDGAIGYIEYSLQIKIKAKNQFAKKIQYPLKIYRKLELSANVNVFEEALKPYICKITSNNFFIKDFKLKIILPVQIGLFSCIPFYVDINNKGHIKVNKIKVALVQTIRYHSKSGYADERKALNKAECGIYSNTCNINNKFNMDVHDLVPSSGDSSGYHDIVNIKYHYQIAVTFPFHLALYEEIPVLITA